MNANSSFHFFSGGPAVKQQLFEIGDELSFAQSDALDVHIHGFVLSNAGGDACVVTFADEDGTVLFTYPVSADGSAVYEGAVPFYVDNGLTITVDAGVGTAAIKWSVSYCGELILR